jgi:peroxiredoxin
MTVVTRRILTLAAAAIATAALTAGALIANSAQAAVPNGAKAPNFSLVDSNGKTRQLSEFSGKTVVLEWTNDGCPFVQKHYKGNMQSLQKAAAADGVVWLSVISSAAGKQGYVDGAGANKLTKDRGAAPAAVLLDPTGKVGKQYGAKTTPHMYIVNAQGNLVYQGGIDDKATSNVADIAGAKNYVKLALADIKAGKPVAIASSQPYGCSVKYAE